ncbi:MAG: hypothetical protein ABFC63_02575 [Thermoguttaceae bacterium]
MNGINFVAVIWLLVAVQALGLCSACVVRLSEGFGCQVISQCLFFVALPIMGVATCFALTVGPGMWVACAASLAAMILIATWDLRVKPEVAAVW